MEALPLQFRIIYYTGLWNYEGDNVSFYRKLYQKFYILANYYLHACAIIQLILSLDNVDKFANATYMAVDWTSFSISIANFIFRQQKLVKLREMYRKTCFQPQNLAEMKIEAKYSARSKKMFRLLCFCYVITVSVPLITPLISSTLTLPFDVYVFYKIDSSWKFWLTYALDSYTVIVAIFLGSALDSLAFGFMILATGQNC